MTSSLVSRRLSPLLGLERARHVWGRLGHTHLSATAASWPEASPDWLRGRALFGRLRPGGRLGGTQHVRPSGKKKIGPNLRIHRLLTWPEEFEATHCSRHKRVPNWAQCGHRLSPVVWAVAAPGTLPGCSSRREL